MFFKPPHNSLMQLDLYMNWFLVPKCFLLNELFSDYKTLDLYTTSDELGTFSLISAPTHTWELSVLISAPTHTRDLQIGVHLN